VLHLANLLNIMKSLDHAHAAHSFAAPARR